MYRIIGGRDTGKTNQLLKAAKETGATVVCNNTYAMGQKSLAYGIVGVDLISYEEYLNTKDKNKTYLIDDIEVLINNYLPGTILGYTISNED